MKILFESPCPPISPWERAAKAMGHELASYKPSEALEAFARFQPDLVVVPSEVGRALSKALTKYPTQVVSVRWDSSRGWTRPAADVPKDFSGGRQRPEFIADVAFVGDCKPEHNVYLDRLKDIRVLVFGNGLRPECVGRVPGGDVADVYASAKVSLDLNGSPGVVMAILASGGRCVSVRTFESGVGPLDATPGNSDLLTFGDLVHHELNMPGPIRSADILAAHTYQDRLAELLAWAARPIGSGLSV